MKKNEKLLESVIEGILEKQGEKIVSMKFDKKNSGICDYFVVCETESSRRAEAVADSVLEFARKKAGEKAIHVEGRENAQWILIDFGDIIVHIFQTPYRKLYNLEGLWADATIMQITGSLTKQ